MLGWAFSTSEQFFATAQSRWVIRVCVGIVNLSICNCKGTIIFNQNPTFRKFCTQRRESIWSFTQPFLTASAEPFLWRHLSKIKLRLWANCWEDQFQVWYVFWAILRAPTDSEFWNSSVWRKCLPAEIVEGQVSRPNWVILGQLVFTWSAARKSIIFIDLSCWSTKMFWLFSSMLTRSCFWIDFKICRDRSILPPAIPDWSRLPRTLSGVLFSGRSLFSSVMDVSVFDFFRSWNLEFKLIWAISACSLSIAWLVTASLCFSREDVYSCDAGTWARICCFCFGDNP